MAFLHGDNLWIALNWCSVEYGLVVYQTSAILDIVVVDLGFTMLLISQVISVAFYSEREKSNKFCSEA